MKKLLSVLLVMILAASVCLADDIDFSTMTDDELYGLINSARIELLARLANAEEKTVLCDDDDIQVYLTGKYKEGFFGLELEAVFVNKTDKMLGLYFDNIVIDGWEVTPLTTFDFVGSGKKKKDSITLKYEDADLSNYKEMTDIEVSFHTFDESYNNVKSYKNILFNFAEVVGINAT